jgi:OOP family OmpA-OmpF porin
MKKSFISLAAAILSANIAFAGASTFELGVMGNQEFVDKDSAIKQNLKSWGARANYRIYENFLLGLEYGKSESQPFRANPNVETDMQRYLLNAFYEVDTDASYTPYALFGVGYQDIDREVADFKDGAIAQIGAGWKFKALDFLNLFIEGKYIRDIENELDNFAIGAGLTIPFGQTSEPAPQEPEVVDSDCDGVPDESDLCPNTPAGVEVDAKGCPLDSDGDGVPDYKDRCPDTPAGVEVDEFGCEIVKDSDGDGVKDDLDQCPDTPSGVVVDKNGCPVVFNLQIHFDFDSAEVKPEYLPKIEEVVEFLKAHPGYKAEIQGHTDSIGSAEYNKKLSLRRAKAVYDIMVKMGIEPERLTYVGYGEERPIAPNTTPEGRAKNRRVEVHILY